jgi:hypothetical protein
VAGTALLITLIRSPQGIAGTEYLKKQRKLKQERLAAQRADRRDETAELDRGPREAEKAMLQ